MRNLVAIASSRLFILLLNIFTSNFYILIRKNEQLVGFLVIDIQISSSLRDRPKFTTANPTRQILQKLMFWLNNTTVMGSFYEMLEGIESILNWTLLIEKSM